jgi:hypothetical protein
MRGTICKGRTCAATTRQAGKRAWNHANGLDHVDIMTSAEQAPLPVVG